MEPEVFLGGNPLFRAAMGSQRPQIVSEICNQTGLHSDEFYLMQNGKLVHDNEIHMYSNIHVHLRLLGGKGGFGSMLRAIGAQIEKTTNREACRDLSGRRLRDINEEKRLKEWLEKQKDREAEAEERKRKKLAKLLSVPKHEFKDSEYEAARSDLTEKLGEAVEEGFKRAVLRKTDPIALKRKANDNGLQKTKKAALWIDNDLDGDSSDDSDSESDSDNDSKGESSKSSNSSESKTNTEQKRTESSTNSNDASEGESSKSSSKDEDDKKSSVVQN